MNERIIYECEHCGKKRYMSKYQMRDHEKICRNNSDYKEVRNKIYEALDRRAGTKIKTRLENMKARALVAGMTRSKVDALGYLDVIAEDKKLIEIYTAIVKEMAIKKGVA